jgi:uncharacterized protein YggE
MRALNTLMLATALTFPLTGMSMADTRPPANITVTGEGRVDSAPDMATISLGVTTDAATAAEAMSRNSTQLATVLANLKAAGIEDRFIQTSGLSLNPNWTNSMSSDGSGAPVIAGYIASNMLTVQVNALDTLGGVLDAAVSDGANSLNGVTFGLKEPKPLMDEARKRAVADAQDRAKLLTGAAGATLGPILTISEGGAFTPPMPMFRMEAAASDAVPVAAGQVSTAVSVTITWEITQ